MSQWQFLFQFNSKNKEIERKNVRRVDRDVRECRVDQWEQRFIENWPITGLETESSFVSIEVDPPVESCSVALEGGGGVGHCLHLYTCYRSSNMEIWTYSSNNSRLQWAIDAYVLYKMVYGVDEDKKCLKLHAK